MTAARSAQTTAELRKLAHTLDVDENALAMLHEVPAEDLRTLRGQISEALFQADKHYFGRVAALSKTVPVAVSAKLTELALPPLIAARTSELLEPRRAAELVARISPGYLARVSAHMDASRAPEVVAAIPPEHITAIGHELAAGQEWVVIGSFVSAVGPQALAASVASYDGEQLLRISLVLDDPDRIDQIGDMLTDEQVDQMLAAAHEFELWTEIVNQLAHLSDERLDRMRERFAAAPDEVREGYAAAAEAGDLPAESHAILTG